MKHTGNGIGLTIELPSAGKPHLLAVLYYYFSQSLCFDMFWLGLVASYSSSAGRQLPTTENGSEKPVTSGNACDREIVGPVFVCLLDPEPAWVSRSISYDTGCFPFMVDLGVNFDKTVTRSLRLDVVLLPLVESHANKEIDKAL
jgi:hypothetical protein